MKYRAYCVVSGIVFLLVATGHLIRAVNAWPVHIGSWTLPVWVSWFGTLFAAVLAVWAFRIARQPR
jgi:hypothetical protein